MPRLRLPKQILYYYYPHSVEEEVIPDDKDVLLGCPEIKPEKV